MTRQLPCRFPVIVSTLKRPGLCNGFAASFKINNVCLLFLVATARRLKRGQKNIPLEEKLSAVNKGAHQVPSRL